MPARPTTRWWQSEGFLVPVSLLSLVSWTLAQSVYEALAGNPEFLAVRGVTNQQLLGVVLVFNLLPALVLALVWAACRGLGRWPARAWLALVYSAFFLAFFWEVHNRYAYLYLASGELLANAHLLWLVPAGLLAASSLRWPHVFRTFLLALVPGVLIFPAWFLVRTWREPEPPLEAARALVESRVSTPAKSLPPVFLIVFDEVTTYALLDEEGRIDAARFPNFSRLAEESTWFRNATANADTTVRAIPILLTGNPPVGREATTAAYPENLLTVLSPHYEIYVQERNTRFCLPQFFHCVSGNGESPQLQLLRDLAFLYGGRVLPAALRPADWPEPHTWGPLRSVEERLRCAGRALSGFWTISAPSPKATSSTTSTACWRTRLMLSGPTDT